VSGKVSEFALGLLAIASMVIGAWMAWNSWRTGESLTPWPIGPVTRDSSPVLFWFDLATYVIILILGGFAGIMLILR
jgi:hypothetical protein